jgi:hypothetical protein
MLLVDYSEGEAGKFAIEGGHDFPERAGLDFHEFHSVSIGKQQRRNADANRSH